MSAILKFDFQKRKQLSFSEVNYLTYTQKKDTILHVAITFSLKQGETRTSRWTHSTPLRMLSQLLNAINGWQLAKMKKSIPDMSLP